MRLYASGPGEENQRGGDSGISNRNVRCRADHEGPPLGQQGQLDEKVIRRQR